jgi:hypothetical protein
VTRSPQPAHRRIYARPARDSDAEWDAFVEQFIAQVDALIAEAEAAPSDATAEVEPSAGRPTDDDGQVIE